MHGGTLKMISDLRSATKLIGKVISKRKTAVTFLNVSSSRSHLLLSSHVNIIN